MAIKSLNEAYDKKLLDYMCNTCGDANNPDDPDHFRVYQPEDVMTPPECELYEKYWREGDGCCQYVLRVYKNSTRNAHEPAFGLGYLFDRSWCRDILEWQNGMGTAPNDEQLDNLWMPQMFSIVTEATKNVLEPLAPDCDFYLGDNTDPDGHELLVVIPFELREKIDDIRSKFDGIVYATIENIFVSKKGEENDEQNRKHPQG